MPKNKDPEPVEDAQVIDGELTTEEPQEDKVTAIAEIAEAAPVPMSPHEDATGQMLSLVEKVMMNPDLPLERLEKVLDMQERMMERNARVAFDQAIAAASAQIGPIQKNAKVEFEGRDGKGKTSYAHETLDEIDRVVRPILSEHGLAYRFRSKQEGGNLHVTCIISHRDGHFEETTLQGAPDGSGSKNGYQAVGSAATYLQRYTLKLALGLSATKDDDGRGANGPTEQDLKEAYERSVTRAIVAVSRETSEDSLTELWKEIAKERPKITGDKRLLDAFKEQKEEIAEMNRRTDTDLDDEIPY